MEDDRSWTYLSTISFPNLEILPGTTLNISYNTRLKCWFVNGVRVEPPIQPRSIWERLGDDDA